jgi:hypothetical protein
MWRGWKVILGLSRVITARIGPRSSTASPRAQSAYRKGAGTRSEESQMVAPIRFPAA